MNKATRKSAFETNSSSTHSLIISSDSQVRDTIPVNEEGVLEIYPGEFGWEFQSYTDAATKASYCFTWIMMNDSGLVGESEYLNMLKSVLMKETGCKKVVFNTMQNIAGYGEFGYIDHQSYEACFEAFETEENLRNFIFNTASILTTDNDNH